MEIRPGHENGVYRYFAIGFEPESASQGEYQYQPI